METKIEDYELKAEKFYDQRFGEIDIYYNEHSDPHLIFAQNSYSSTL